jgi:Domain of unknown function (DUF4337)
MEANEALENFEKAEEHAHGSGLARTAALTVAVVAAFLAISTFLGNEAVKDAIQGQTKVADRNAVSQTFDTQDLVFQSDQVLLLVMGHADDKSLAAEATAGNKALDKTAKKVPAHKKELAAQLADAKKEVNDANKQHLLYEISEVLLQIAIVLASVAIVSNKRFLLLGGQVVAVGGAAMLVVGYLA